MMGTEGKKLVRPSLATIKRFLKHVDELKFGKKCWIWTGAVKCDKRNQNTPYGTFKLAGKSQQAHRMSFAIFYGEVPKGFDVNHECGRHNCVNPDHLGLLSRGANVADGNRKRNQYGYDGIPF